ncbi:SusC/RagA family TonB-linked outer membrane protein [Pseudalgibacter alginicilyticus]|uniref:SusC/RagA family TonB-linked outer membrane protein n=1 Tax=Pseudalgibacter alginicilyticus TaxID=1736674 RepID=A0A0P0D6M0_9FLAO|nr:SusC/RagA family TonB-linked outer membrane protein [Pseudalgibacter alginicilyticus]ALJ04344.1 SusC/RagA family TonB-linked outer membrane protein [Pseudalgibacter alginicilyticus]
MNTKIHFFKNYLSFKYFYLICTLLTINLASANSKKSDNTQVNLNIKNALVTEVFSAIENQTDYTFIFDNSITKTIQKVSINSTNEDLKTVLSKLTKQIGFQFKILNNTITVLNLKKQKVVKGNVVDESGLPLPGASIIEKGTTNGTSTDFNGVFELALTTENAELEISFIGYVNKTVKAIPGTLLKITLQENVNSLNEIVVTALGIKREQKKLGFSQSTVESESLAQTAPNNWSSGLKGKVAGLNIVSSGSGPLNSQQITLRGNNSLNANGNNALIVVDGVPVNNEMTTSGSSNAYIGEDSPIDYGNGISDLNLDDIENVTVLKGPGATALYGSRAANGALIITTKSGKKSKGLGITYNSNISLDVIQRWPDWQYKYGQGTGKSFDIEGNPYYSYGSSEDGNSTGGTSSAWGPEFNGQYYYQYDPNLEGQSLQRELWKPYEDNRKDYWRTGVTTTNNISIQGGNNEGSMRLSVGHSKNEWIMPNTGFERITASLNANYQVSEHIKIGSVINYNNRNSDNLPSTGYNNGSIAYFMIFQNPNVDLDWYRNIWKQGQNQIQQIQPFSSYIDNPYAIAYEATNALASNQIVGNIFSNIQLAPQLKLMLRTSLNTYYQEREQKRPYSINRYKQGFYEAQDVWKQEVNTDFLLSYDNEISDKFSFSASVGGNSMDYKYRRTDASVDGLVVPGVYKLANGINNPLIQTYDKNKRVNSLYGLFSVAFGNKIFLDLTGRNDWSSTLPIENNSFFYPSANASFIMSEIFNLPTAMDYLKYRFSYAQVGNDTDPYKTSKYYSQSAFASSASVATNLFNANFKPEITTSYETGIEARLFNNRINLDATIYETTTKNQIISVPLDITTGYSSGVLNSGEVRNQGIELTLGGKIIKNEKFNWKSTFTWSKNWNEVMKLADGIDGQQEIGSGGNATLLAKVGGTTTAIYGFGFVRSPEGAIVYDNAGLPAYPDEIQYIGDASPDWKAGLNNSFSFGNITFNVMIDGQYGGIVYSQSNHKLIQQGKLTSTYEGRETGFITGDGVVLNTDGTYSPNTTAAITPDWYNRYYRRANVESNSFDASFLKLREMSLQYNFPQKSLKNTGILGLSISVFGRNLATVSDFPIYDPETAALNGDTILPGIEMGQMPSPATYGFNLKVNL